MALVLFDEHDKTVFDKFKSERLCWHADTEVQYCHSTLHTLHKQKKFENYLKWTEIHSDTWRREKPPVACPEMWFSVCGGPWGTHHLRRRSRWIFPPWQTNLKFIKKCVLTHFAVSQTLVSHIKQMKYEINVWLTSQCQISIKPTPQINTALTLHYITTRQVCKLLLKRQE